MKKKSLHSLFIVLAAALFFLPYVQPAAAGDFDVPGSVKVPPNQRITLSERLLLHNAVCALWHNSMKQNPDPVKNVNPATLTAPENIFVQFDAPGFYYNHKNDSWDFIGMVRQMGVRSDGIENISGINSFHMQVKRQADGSFRILFINFET